MKKILLLTLVCSVFLPCWSWSQERNVSGSIVSKTGYPVKNIRLTVVDLPGSAKSNKQGKFTLKKVRSEDTIVVHVNNKAYIKFELGNNDSLKLVLSDDMIAIHQAGNRVVHEPILTGTLYNNETRAISVITAKMIERQNPLTVVDAIKGMVPGVNIETSGNGYIATMRGQKSLNLSNAALIIVDGMETTLDQANNMSVHDIATIECNKDGFGYGVKGANGVIIINTKR